MAVSVLLLHVLSELVELVMLESLDGHPAPALGSPELGAVHELEDRRFAKGGADRVDAPSLFKKETLEQVGRADPPAMPRRTVQVSDAGFELLLKTTERHRQVPLVAPAR